MHVLSLTITPSSGVVRDPAEDSRDCGGCALLGVHRAPRYDAEAARHSG